nr:hypothetical protein P5660_17025 [Bacillus velezensis]
MPDTVVYGWPEGSFAGSEKISEQLSKGAYPLFFFSRALMRSKAEKKVVSLFLYPADHKNDQPLYASVHGAGQSILLENPKLALRQSGYQFQTSHCCRLLQLKSSDANQLKRIREKPIFIMKEMCAGCVPYGKQNRLKTQVSPLKKTEYT